MTSETATSSSDITNRQDIIRLVDAFYTRLRADDLLGPLFDEVARVNWDTHLPLMYDFWDSVLFSSGRYHGNPLAAHQTLARQAPLTDRAFFRWLTMWEATVDELFDGAVANNAKESARRIAAALQLHLSGRAPLSVEGYMRRRTMTGSTRVTLLEGR